MPDYPNPVSGKTGTAITIPSEAPDVAYTQAFITPRIQYETCNWVPQMDGGWEVGYDREGIGQVSQTWIAPRSLLTPLVVRQLLSWNRQKYQDWAYFNDFDATAIGKYKRSNVVVSAKLTPFLASSAVDPLFGQMHSPAYPIYSKYPCDPDWNPQGDCPAGRFPSIATDKWRIDLTWAPDEFTNRFGIVYAKVEIEPSLRFESMQGASLGVVPLDSATGLPKNDPAGYTDVNAINKVGNGFPMREPQLVIKVTYPWVRMQGLNYSIESAGPIGKYYPEMNRVGQIPEGLYLGCVNDNTFLGYKRGHVLYQSAELTERVSPVTRRLGYQVTHVFLVHPTAPWNYSRYMGDISTFTFSKNTDADDPVWPYGAIVATKKSDGLVFSSNIMGSPYVYPYIHKDFSKLLYYGTDSAPVVPNDEA